MPYKSKKELPKQVKGNLPEGAQEIYQDAFNNAEDFYADPKKRRNKSEDKDTVAAKVAWNAVKNKYEKKGEEWVKK